MGTSPPMPKGMKGFQHAPMNGTWPAPKSAPKSRAMASAQGGPPPPKHGQQSGPKSGSNPKSAAAKSAKHKASQAAARGAAADEEPVVICGTNRAPHPPGPVMLSSPPQAAESTSAEGQAQEASLKTDIKPFKEFLDNAALRPAAEPDAAPDARPAAPEDSLRTFAAPDAAPLGPPEDLADAAMPHLQDPEPYHRISGASHGSKAIPAGDDAERPIGGEEAATKLESRAGVEVDAAAEAEVSTPMAKAKPNTRQNAATTQKSASSQRPLKEATVQSGEDAELADEIAAAPCEKISGDRLLALAQETAKYLASMRELADAAIQDAQILAAEQAAKEAELDLREYALVAAEEAHREKAKKAKALFDRVQRATANLVHQTSGSFA